jgi:hypothetical protein
VSFPKPEPGLVVRYSFLWHREAEQGREDGLKDRPCAIVLAVADEAGQTRVVVLPITHTPPTNPGDAIEIPQTTKRRLGLDANRSWVVTTETNLFTWPGPDLRPSRNGDTSTIAFGVLPQDLFARIRESYLEHDRRRRAKTVRRTQ